MVPTEQVVAAISDKPFPRDEISEKNVIGSLILDHRMLPDVVEIFGDTDPFQDASLSLIYAAITQLVDRTGACDTSLLLSDLTERGYPDEMRGQLLEYAQTVTTPTNAQHYAKNVWLAHQKSNLLTALVSGSYNIQNGEELNTIAADVGQAVTDVVVSARGELAIPELMQEQIELMQANSEHGFNTRAISTGYTQIDRMLGGGYGEGDLIIVGARPSMGKTAFLVCNMLRMTALGTPSMFVTCEMGRDQVAQRMLCTHSQIDSVKLRRGLLDSRDMEKAIQGCAELQPRPATIIDRGGLTLNQFRSFARKFRQDNDRGVIFIDYLQLMRDPKSAREGRTREVSELSRGLKEIARDVRMPIVCACQLNREVTSRANKRPMLSDLRESGSIEQDADIVAMLHWPWYYERDANLEDQKFSEQDYEIGIAKQRNGPAGTMKLAYRPEHTRVYDVAEDFGGQKHDVRMPYKDITEDEIPF